MIKPHISTPFRPNPARNSWQKGLALVVACEQSPLCPPTYSLGYGSPTVGTGNVSWNPGRIWNFDGTEKLVYGNFRDWSYPIRPNQEPIVLFARIRPEATESCRILSHKQNDTVSNQGWQIGLDSSNFVATAFDNGTSQAGRTAITDALAANTWATIGCTFSPGGINQTKTRIYKDGVMIRTSGGTPLAGTFMTYAQNPTIGGEGQAINHLDGDIDVAYAWFGNYFDDQAMMHLHNNPYLPLVV